MIRNGIPQNAILIEYIVGFFMLFLTIRAIIRYYQKQSRISYYLTFALSAYSLAALGTATGKFIHFNADLMISNANYSQFMIVIGYCFLSIGNAFFTVILKELYFDNDSQYPLFLIICNGVIIGLFLSDISPRDGLYDEVLPILFLFILVSFIIHGTFIRNSLREARNQESKVAKIGFNMISGFSISFILVIVSFVIDLIVGISSGQSYTSFYYIGWILVGVSTLFGFLGFIMPSWFRNLVSKSQ